MVAFSTEAILEDILKDDFLSIEQIYNAWTAAEQVYHDYSNYPTNESAFSAFSRTIIGNRTSQGLRPPLQDEQNVIAFLRTLKSYSIHTTPRVEHR